ncbi:Adenylate kinase 2-like protein [Dinothrombium tinctorium]|uniref:Adenylate kinase 2-like protein n=1 Tax=Dinothrombium tinctorium TaxID=1965070 RepID=A0A3S3NBF8_9ACAR|nr:Adenylate kinase 2-like protein [Dinothrombium tinctorium]
MTDDVTGELLIRRSDDNPDALKKRLAVYHEDTKPMIDYYSIKGIHTAVDASLAASQVFQQIENAIKKAKSKDFVLFV